MEQNKKILGLSWSHPSGACLFEGTKITSAVSEERFTRIKNDTVFPKNSIDYCISQVDSLDYVAFAELDILYRPLLYQSTKLTLEEMVKEQHEVWKPRIYEGQNINDAEVFKERWSTEQYPPGYWDIYDPSKEETFNTDRLKMCSDYMGVPLDKVITVEHHTCHAYYGYYSSPFYTEKALIVTVDGFGDGLNATISIADGTGNIERVFESSKCLIGRIYSYVTLILGMKRLEHEYKVMGLAPYAKQKYCEPASDIFFEILDVDGLDFVSRKPVKDMYFALRERLEGIRFDNIAGGLQLWSEKILSKWIENICEHFKIDTLIMSGGVSMNVKAMGKIAELEQVKKFFVAGSSSDDSLSVGAAMYVAKHNEGIEAPLCENLYLGPPVTKINEVLDKASCNPDYKVIKNYSNSEVVNFLSEGLVIARCFGNGEFGQRALGNRSILADPTIPGIVEKINHMIKQRDFWMPFAPVVLDTFAKDYLVNPKNHKSPHMTLGFETTEVGFESMKSGCHPADKTARAQILERNINPGLYDLLNAFAEKTGRGALMNTSFNLHGYPIVNNAEEAYYVFEQSELDGLILDNDLILRKKSISI